MIQTKIISTLSPLPYPLNKYVQSPDIHTKISALTTELKHLLTFLTVIAEKHLDKTDPGHDIHHAFRVLFNSLHIMEAEGGDPWVIFPAALLHDIVNIPKDDPSSSTSADLSAEAVYSHLKNLPIFPKKKLRAVRTATSEHSFSKGIKPETLESQIVQDADRLEALGSIGLIRTFTTVGKMETPLYHPADPFLLSGRQPEAKQYGLDFIYTRMLDTAKNLNTTFAKKWASERLIPVRTFLTELQKELFLPGARPDYQPENET
jgi:uncharacterized protein